jgi:hypothetical protein
MTISLIELFVATVKVIEGLRLECLIVSQALVLVISLGSLLHSDILALLVAEDI